MLLQRPQQILHGVRQGNGAGGVRHQERAHDEQNDPQHHLNGGNNALPCDAPQQPHVRHRRTGGKEHVHDGRERHHEIHRLQPLGQRLERHPRHQHRHRQHRDHDPVGQHAFGAEQRHDIENDTQELRPGIQPVYRRVRREKLSQRDILQHTPAPPLSASSRCSSASTVYTAGSISSPRARSAAATFVT